MRSRFRPSPAMIVACIALFVALGGTATAVTYVVSSNSQIGPGTVSGHKPPTGKHSNIIAGSVNATDLASGSVRLSSLEGTSCNEGFYTGTTHTYYLDGVAETVCRQVVMNPIAGDGIVQNNEQCDDGNAVDGDGCSSTGTLEFKP
jgi:cysteine-rich repeat protein